MTQAVDFLLVGAGELLTLQPESGEGPLGIIRGGAVGALDGQLVWVGRTADVRKAIWLIPGGRELDARGLVVMPGFVDSHTHLCFAGFREREFARRAAGASYQEIAASGGGILATVEATRDATADEVKMLEAIQTLARSHPMRVHPTFCGAHEVPPEYRGNTRGYVDLVVNEMLPEVARRGLARSIDVFCEAGVFSVEQARRILVAGRELGLRAKIHADEFVSSGGAELAASVGALSADHLLAASLDGIRAMAGAGVTATLLPGTAFFLGLPYAPARAFLETGVELALATDFNPGSSYTPNMQLMLTLACTQMKMSVEEAIRAATVGGARALGLKAEVGSLRAGKVCDLAVLDVPNHYHLPYLYGVNHVRTVVKGGRVAWPVED